MFEGHDDLKQGRSYWMLGSSLLGLQEVLLERLCANAMTQGSPKTHSLSQLSVS